MNFFLAGCSCAVPVGNPLAPVFAPSWNALQNAWASGRAQHIQGAALLFSLEPTLPARPAHYTHLVGRLHVRHGPTRLALVDRADRVYEAA